MNIEYGQSYEILTPISEGGIRELQLIERAARVCYKSENKITPDGESAKKLVKFLVKQDHEAMLEHSILSVLFRTNRGIANELVRHRHCAFAQESTRYCNYSGDRFGGEITVLPSFLDPATGSVAARMNEHEKALATEALEEAESDYFWALEGLEMRPEFARDFLPICTKTEIVVTANYREWRHIFKLRCAVGAHPQIRALMCPLLKDIQKQIPIVFDDIYTYWPDDVQ